MLCGTPRQQVPEFVERSVFRTHCNGNLGLSSRKCGTAVPTSGQCLRANKTCHGYRNQLDLSLRNESDSVIEKVKAKSKKLPPRTKEALVKQHPAHKTTTEISVSNVFTGSVSSDNSSLVNFLNPDKQSIFNRDHGDANLLALSPSSWSTLSLTPTIEVGTNFFLGNFVAQPSGPSCMFF